ncbi:MAG: AI-2E family transporter [Candidatus Accumulibacter sp.]|jgi:predicted PurR-regulated permease PerM|nr:AI-2E family transporter [Accumulibacter sp.]
MYSIQKNIIQIVIVSFLLIGCFAVLTPFIGTLLLAIALSVATAPLRDRLLRLCGGRRSLTATILCFVLVVVLILPMALLSTSFADAIETILDYLHPFFENGLPAHLPDWVAEIPLIGTYVSEYWRGLAGNYEETNELLRQFLAPTRRLALSAISLFGQGLMQLGMVIFFTFFIYRDADIYSRALYTASTRLAGDLGERMFRLANGTVTGVMIGIIGTAAAQAVVALIGFLIAGIPEVLMLSVATFFFSMVPVVGATLIWGGAAIWLYGNGQTGWTVFMLFWGIFCISSVDNFIKPILISRTSSLPLLLIVVGVLGGVLAFGFIGLFIGPTLLALSQALINEWLDRAEYEEFINRD